MPSTSSTPVKKGFC